jgi:hypothetical protein
MGHAGSRDNWLIRVFLLTTSEWLDTVAGRIESNIFISWNHGYTTFERYQEAAPLRL